MIYTSQKYVNNTFNPMDNKEHEIKQSYIPTHTHPCTTHTHTPPTISPADSVLRSLYRIFPTPGAPHTSNSSLSDSSTAISNLNCRVISRRSRMCSSQVSWKARCRWYSRARTGCTTPTPTMGQG